jgi:hypothetical protein
VKENTKTVYYIVTIMSASTPNILDTVFADSPVIERRVSETLRADSKESWSGNTVKEMEDLEISDEDQNATPYDHKLITS